MFFWPAITANIFELSLANSAKEAAIKRLSARAKTESARVYDLDPEIIIHRLEVYEKKAPKVAEYFQKQNKFSSVSGEGNADEVFQRLSLSVESLMKKIR